MLPDFLCQNVFWRGDKRLVIQKLSPLRIQFRNFQSPVSDLAAVVRIPAQRVLERNIYQKLDVASMGLFER